MTTVTLTLFSDAKARTNRFAICDRYGAPVWYGRFFEDDQDYDGEQSSGEMAAAKKAVWLAGRVKAAVGADALHLTLKVDAEWLTWANESSTSRKGGKARALATAATSAGVDLVVDYIFGIDNPADRYTVASGYATYKSVDLATLVDGAERASSVPAEDSESTGATAQTIARALTRCAARAGDHGATASQVYKLAHLMAEAGEDGSDYMLSTTLALTKREASGLIDMYSPNASNVGAPTAVWIADGNNAWRHGGARVFRKYRGRNTGYQWFVTFPDGCGATVASEQEGKAYAEVHVDEHVKPVAAEVAATVPKSTLVRQAYPEEWKATLALTSKPRSRAQTDLYRRYDAEHGAA